MLSLRLTIILTIAALPGACDRGPSTPAASAGAHAAHARGVTPTTAHLQLTVDGSGYHPSSLRSAPNSAVHLSVTRTSDEGCGQQIVFPSLNIRRDLPLNQSVDIEFTMPPTGEVAFTCGMSMMRGSIVAN